MGISCNITRPWSEALLVTYPVETHVATYLDALHQPESDGKMHSDPSHDYSRTQYISLQAHSFSLRSQPLSLVPSLSHVAMAVVFHCSLIIRINGTVHDCAKFKKGCICLCYHTLRSARRMPEETSRQSRHN